MRGRRPKHEIRGLQRLKNQKVEKTIEMAKNKGAKYFDVTSVSHITKKILDEFSFKEIYTLPYANFTENGEKLFINIKPENDTCFYMAAKL